MFTRFCGGDEGDRTPYLLNAIQALSQVSYTPTGRIRKRYFRVPYYNIKPALECQENIAKKYYLLSFNLQNRFL